MRTHLYEAMKWAVFTSNVQMHSVRRRYSQGTDFDCLKSYHRNCWNNESEFFRKMLGTCRDPKRVPKTLFFKTCSESSAETWFECDTPVSESTCDIVLERTIVFDKPAVPKLFGCWAKIAISSASAGRTTLYRKQKQYNTHKTSHVYIFVFIFFAR